MNSEPIDSESRDQRAHAASLESTVVANPLPTMTGGIPVVEDAMVADSHGDLYEAPHYEGDKRHRVTALVIAVLTTLNAIGPLATDMYTPAFPQVAADLSTTAATLQLTLTAFFVGVSAGQIVAGPLSDRLGRRTPLLVGIGLAMIGSILCAVAPSAGILLFARVIQGLGGGFGMVLGRSVLLDLARGPELFRTLNIMQGIVGVAPIVAPLLGGLILLAGQWHEIFWVIAGMSLISLVGVIFVIPESLPASQRHSGGFRTFLTNSAALFKRPLFITYALMNAFSAFALMAYVSASSFIVQSMMGYGSTVFSLMFAINATGLMLMSFLSAKLSSTVAPRKLIRIGLSVAAFSAVLLLVASLFFGTPEWLVFPAFFLMVASQGFVFGNGGGLASRESLDMAGTGSAILGLGFSFAASAAAPLVGLGGAHTSLPMALTMVAGVAISLVCYVIAGRTRSTVAKDSAF